MSQTHLVTLSSLRAFMSSKKSKIMRDGWQAPWCRCRAAWRLLGPDVLPGSPCVKDLMLPQDHAGAPKGCGNLPVAHPGFTVRRDGSYKSCCRRVPATWRIPGAVSPNRLTAQVLPRLSCKRQSMWSADHYLPGRKKTIFRSYDRRHAGTLAGGHPPCRTFCPGKY